ncbi:MAG TPA: signal peptidase I [Nocardioides sp.]|nr:signal peptidase I [Nocardioides sp.]
MTHRAEGRPWLRTAFGVAALVVFFAGMLVVIAVLAFSVKVSGHSMEPTLEDGDRLVVNPFGNDDVARFDIVESTLGDREIPVVKRVIGMPGDRIQASAEADPPVVRIKPAGEDTVYVVDNPAWSGRVGDKVEPCCAEDGTTLPRGEEPGWVSVPDGQFWLVGDNWGGSDDSRTFGYVTQEQITARISFRVQPFGDLGRLPNDVTLVAED